MALALMAKAFKLNYSTPTNNNQRISSNTRNRQIAQPGMNMGQDRQIQMIGGNGNQNQIGNGNLVAARAERNAAGQNGNQIRCNNCRGVEEYDLMAAAADLDKIKEVNANCILMANLQQASTLGTQTDSAPVYDTDGSAERISSNPKNRQIAQPGMNIGQDKQMQMVGGNGGNQFRQYTGQNAGNPAGYNDVIRNQVNQNAVQNPRVPNVRNQNGLIGVQGNGNQNQIGNKEYDLIAAAADLNEIKEVNTNCILMANLQQASTSGTQTDSAPVYDTDGSAEVHENCDDNEIFNMFTQEEQYTELLNPFLNHT
nr:hypothetical protein [Tanacetum cinerariifolium]